MNDSDLLTAFGSVGGGGWGRTGHPRPQLVSLGSAKGPLGKVDCIPWFLQPGIHFLATLWPQLQHLW